MTADGAAQRITLERPRDSGLCGAYRATERDGLHWVAGGGVRPRHQ